MLYLLYLIAVPIWIFLFSGAAVFYFRWLDDYVCEWWPLPLTLSLFIPGFFAFVVGLIVLVSLGLSGQPDPACLSQQQKITRYCAAGGGK